MEEISSNFTTDFYKDGSLIRTESTGEMTIPAVSKSDEGLYKCNNSELGESPQSWLAVRVGAVILESPVLPMTEGEAVTLRCRYNPTPSNLSADFYKDGSLIRTESTREMTIPAVSKSDEGLYKCNNSDQGESPQSWLVVRTSRLEVGGREVTYAEFRVPMATQPQTSKRRASLSISPDRSQFIKYESVSLSCEEQQGSSTGWRVKRYSAIGGAPGCGDGDGKGNVWGKAEGSSCTISYVYPQHSGEYWCESDSGERSTAVNITVTDGAVILESPVLPVMEGEAVTLRCRYQTTPSNLSADFYKDGSLNRTESTREMTIPAVSKSDEGLYKCNNSDLGESPQSWLVVRDGAVILESPVLPVMEGEAVTLRCRYQTTPSNLSADFYKDGSLIRTKSTREMTIPAVSKSDEGLYKCNNSELGESPQSWLVVRAGAVILESPVLPVTEGEAVTLRCRYQTTPSNLTTDFYKDGSLIRTESTREMTIPAVSKSDEGLYKCHNSDLGDSPQSWLVVRDLSPPASLSASPDRSQFFKYESVSLSCEEQQGNSTGWRVKRYSASGGAPGCGDGDGIWGKAENS
ncbi:Fc receptor-like protein 5, partial [Aplochiton taeniatus]